MLRALCVLQGHLNFLPFQQKSWTALQFSIIKTRLGWPGVQTVAVLFSVWVEYDRLNRCEKVHFWFNLIFEYILHGKL